MFTSDNIESIAAQYPQPEITDQMRHIATDFNLLLVAEQAVVLDYLCLCFDKNAHGLNINEPSTKAENKL